MSLLEENTLWIALASALGAAALAVVLSALFFSRRRPRADERPASSLEAANARLEQTVADLRTELDGARSESRRFRRLSAIVASIDLECVLSRTLEAAADLPVAEAAMIAVPREGAAPLVATLGLSAEEAEHVPAPRAPGDRRARAIAIAYRYDAEAHDGDVEPIRGGLVVPLPSDADEPIGTLSVFWRNADREPADEDVRGLEDLAVTAGPAIENAQRFREARKLADLDALTSLHNRRYFHETLAREVARAQRYERRLALVVFDVDDFKAVNERVGHLAGDAVLAELAERVRSVVRSADVACRVGGDEFAVILPESTAADGEQLYDRLQRIVSTRPTGPEEALEISAGVAELRAADDAVSLFERADVALFRAKDTGNDHAVAAEGT
jgi:diguanylate cyclase (GGDEF)-like protein